MNEVKFKDKQLQEWVIKYYGHDGRITCKDLENVEMLEITTEELQCLDETREKSFITKSFHTPSDLKKFPKLIALEIHGQWIFWVNLQQESIEEVGFMHCPTLFAIIGKRLRISLRAFFGYWNWFDFKKKGLEPKNCPLLKILHKIFK